MLDAEKNVISVRQYNVPVGKQTVGEAAFQELWESKQEQSMCRCHLSVGASHGQHANG
jgi:hypothetical protein